MQALILAGGKGTRLRPLTTTVPKPVMPLAGRPFLSFMLDWLRGHGVDDALFCCGFLADDVRRVLGSEYAGVRLRYLCEETPLGTAGPLRLAADDGLLDERFLVLNGDVLTDVDLSAQMRQHVETGATATLALVAVEDTASYGVVPTAPDGRVEAFLEKSPGPAPTNRINAGAYVLEREVVGAIPSGCAVSIEREVFPGLVAAGLYGYVAEGYWMDIGTPERYIEATRDLLSGRVASDLAANDREGSLIYSGCWTDGAVVRAPSVLGDGCSVGPGSVIDRSVLHREVSVGRDCVVEESVLADGVRVQDGARIGAGALVGPGASIGRGAQVEPGARIVPGARVS
jgi:mannose-1-phosphate guanylyltransferase